MSGAAPAAVVTSGSYAPYRDDWLALHTEPALEPDLPIVDAHHHLWDAPRPKYMYEDMRRDIAASGHNVVATVHVDCRSMYRQDGPAELRSVGEVEFVNGVAAMAASGAYGTTRACAGIVGFGALHLGARARPVLEALVQAGGARFKGVRQISAWDDDPRLAPPNAERPPGLLADRTFREGFALLAPLGLRFDAWLYQTQIPELTDLARAFPETPIVLDHAGTPVGIGRYAGRRRELFGPWKNAIVELASCPNVSIKLGGLGMIVGGFGFNERERPPTSVELAEAWKPYVETCIEAFGASRCMFESNFPPDRATCSYGVLWNAFKRMAAGASTEEKAALFAGTAQRFYGLFAR
ncbi:amidohydrolase family protein [Ramlibacter sp.]|uniref:amidohydrolase family protein n=1 Tax=Ramlibacter sp. TaxID=1917967 RepID=UPI003D0F9EDE